MRLLLLLMALGACARHAPSRDADGVVPFDLAITIDDLPWASVVPPDGRGPATDRLLGHLAARHVVATGFVNCGKPEQELLERWRAAGHTLGNHTSSHLDIDKVPLDDWLADARTCHEALEAQLGAPPTLFRFPYLRNGDDEATRDAARDTLLGWGQVLGRVTVDNHEWKIAFLYGEARRDGDEARARALAGTYVSHVRAATAHYRAVARDRLGREPAHVLLLHANWLASDHLGTLLDALAEDGARFVPLEQALQDPLYAMPDARITAWGTSWLHHVAPHDTDGDFDTAEWRALIGAYEPEG